MEAEKADPETVDADVEVPFPNWAPIDPTESWEPQALALVDGIRRLDARLVAEVKGEVVHAVLASVAAGSVRIVGGEASFDSSEVKRVLAIGSGQTEDALVVRPDLVYEPWPWEGEGPDAPLRGALERMRRLETDTARNCAKSGAMVLADGPIGVDSDGVIVGYVKRIERLYVPTSATAVIAQLRRGQRTPIFLLNATRSPRYGWFLRLADPLRGESALSGVARLEVLSSKGRESARAIADFSARALPRLAPSRARDPRSPQNLVPIGALEANLRRLLGDHRWLRTQIRVRLAQEEQNA